jgi:hypothetical protein
VAGELLARPSTPSSGNHLAARHLRFVPDPEVANRNGLPKKCSQRVLRRLVVDSFCTAPARFDYVRLSFANQVKAAKIPGSCKS